MNKNKAAFMEWGWLALAVSIPFFSISIFRINSGDYHVPIPAFIIVVLLALILLNQPLFQGRLKGPSDYRTLFVLTLLILTTHGISMFAGNTLEYSLREFVKISSGIITFWLVILFFPNDSQFLKKFLKVGVGASLALLTALLYQYVIVFKAPYLGTLFSWEITLGKNYLAWLLVLLSPYCLTFLFEKRIRFFWVIANTIFGISIVYIMSRSSWIAMILVLGYLGFFSVRDRLQLNFKMAAIIMIGMTLSLGFLVWHTDFRKILYLRIQSIYDPQSIPEIDHGLGLGLGKYSKQRRWERIQKGLSVFRENPWMGQSLGSSFRYAYLNDEMITHNDYVCLLSETGLMGAIPFLIFLVFFSKELMQIRTDQPRPFLLRSSQASFLALLFLSNFLNIYTSMHYWFFLALALKTKQISELSPPEDIA